MIRVVRRGIDFRNLLDGLRDSLFLHIFVVHLNRLRVVRAPLVFHSWLYSRAALEHHAIRELTGDRAMWGEERNVKHKIYTKYLVMLPLNLPRRREADHAESAASAPHGRFDQHDGCDWSAVPRYPLAAIVLYLARGLC